MTDTQVRHFRSLDAALAFTIAVLVMGTILVVFEPRLRVVAVAPRIDLVINTIATLAAVGVAALAWTRYAEQGGVALVFQSAAFAVLASAGTLFVIAAVSGLDDGLGLTIAHPTQAPVYVWTLARLLASGLLVTGAVADLRGYAMTRPMARKSARSACS